MNLSALTQKLGGLPVWAWAAIVGGGGAALFFFIRRSQGGASAGALGQNAQAAPPDMSQIDPNTGVPYSVEEATNPATGLPAYYGGPGVDQSSPPTSAPPPVPPIGVPPTSGPPGPMTTKPPVPAPAPVPPVAPPHPPPGPTPAPVPPVAPDHPVRHYTVVRGDTLSRIAARFGVGTTALGHANESILSATAAQHGISGTSRYGNYPRAWDYLYPGENLVIPGGGPGNGRGNGPNGGACPFGLACGDGCRGHCQSQATPFWPQMTDLGVN